MNGTLLGKSAQQFALAWLLAFAGVLAVELIGVGVLKAPFVETTNLVLTLAMSTLGFAAAIRLVTGLMSREPAGSKIGLILLCLVLILPLLWAPVAGAATGAAATGHAIEYSGVYAAFRIAVGRLLYPLGAALLSSAAIDTVWRGFQVIASLVGFAASALEILRFLGRRSARAAWLN